jgi:hypothetical protein
MASKRRSNLKDGQGIELDLNKRNFKALGSLCCHKCQAKEDSKNKQHDTFQPEKEESQIFLDIATGAKFSNL